LFAVFFLCVLQAHVLRLSVSVCFLVFPPCFTRNISNLDDAYLTNAAGDFSQYMFGPNLMVAPIVAKSSEDTGLSSKNIWIPPGCWFEIDFGHVYCTNGSVVNREYGLTEIPRFVPANKILLRSKQSAFDVDVFPNFASPSSSSYSLYEDDGVTTAYLDSSSFRVSFEKGKNNAGFSSLTR
jgi:alpha-glucosidase (family GH31 glycosyl hydrolase)